MTKNKEAKAVVTVKVQKSKKLTVNEINALTEVTIQSINDAVRKHNATFKDSLEHKADVKAIKTKYGVLKAERAMVQFALKHPKVSFKIDSPECDYEIKMLENSKKKSTLNTNRTYCDDFNNIKNRLILEQVDSNQSVFELADKIAQEYLKK